jgi:hypothetical protein
MSTLETVNSSSEEFVDMFIDYLKQLQTHDSVAYQQAVFIQETIYCLKDGDTGAVGDFAKELFIYCIRCS